MNQSLTPTGTTRRRILTAVAVACSVWLASCSHPRKIERDDDGGTILDAQVVPTSFNESQKMQIRTDRIVVVIWGFASVPVGQKATLRTYTDGSRAICWEGDPYVHFIY